MARIGTRRAIGKGQGAATFVGAYDAIASLVHVYEPARCTLSAYSGGNLVRLRRASDDEESDFSHVSVSDPELNLAAIAAWAGGASYIVSIYDQVGGDTLTMATKAYQPLFVASIQNGHAGGRFNGLRHFLRGTFTLGGALSQPFSTYLVAALDAVAVDTGTKVLADGSTDQGMSHRQRAQAGADTWSWWAGSFVDGGASDSNWNLWACLWNGASSQFWHNNVSEGTGNAGAYNPVGVTVGADRTGANWWDGAIVCAVIADPAHTDLQRAAMQTAINAYWGAY